MLGFRIELQGRVERSIFSGKVYVGRDFRAQGSQVYSTVVNFCFGLP